MYIYLHIYVQKNACIDCRQIVIQKNVDSPFSFSSKKDELRRKTKGYLPECDVAFIDEIFKVHLVTDCDENDQ